MYRRTRTFRSAQRHSFSIQQPTRDTTAVQDAIHERDAEVERSKELIARAAPKGSPNSLSHPARPLGMDDPKMAEVIKFYEDMSNLLVTNVKFEHAPNSEEPEVILHCIYTYYEMTRRADDIKGERIGEKSLSSSALCWTTAH